MFLVAPEIHPGVDQASHERQAIERAMQDAFVGCEGIQQAFQNL
jgi:hypothetical protein